MPTQSGKIKFTLVALGSTALGLSLSLAQTTPPAPAAPAPAAAAPAAPAAPPAAVQNAPTTGGTTDGLGNAANSGLYYLYHQRADNGSAAKDYFQAKEVAKSKELAREAAGDRIADAAMLDRFIKFLGMSEISPDTLKSYKEDTDATLSLLRDKKTFEAWHQLFKLASYRSFDAGISEELANRVSTIWDAGKTTDTLAQQNVAYQQQIADSNNNADMMSKEVQREQLEYAKAMKNAGVNNQRNNNNQQQQSQSNSSSNSTNGTNTAANTVTPTVDSETTPPPSVTPYLGKLELTQEFMNSLEDRARMKINELKAQKLLDSTKTDFSNYIKDLSDRKYYRNVLLAADFYRSLFDEGDYPVAVAKEVDTALAADRDVENSLDVFRNKVSTGEIAAATDELETAFMTDEFHPALLTVPREMKAKVEKFIIDLRKMENMIEVRDYGSLDPLLADLQKLAPDFDATKANSLVTAVKMESSMHLRHAAMLAQSKDPGANDQALAEFNTAAETWPGNPDLNLLSDKFFKANDAVNQSLTEFDRLVSDKNYRAIFDKQLMFAPAMKDDALRQDQLKDALLKVKNAEVAIEKATAMQSAGNISGAWETIELASKDLPDDNKLNSMRADLAGRAAEFVAAINKAEDSETKGDLGFSLTWYAIAQRTYPASAIANDAIDRISKQILEKSSI